MTTTEKLRVLFLCTGNACRSQMAEGWARHLHGERIDVRSAGVRPHAVDPLAVRVMAEAGVDISAQQSKHAGQFAGEKFDYVITLCDSAAESCPRFPGAGRTVHRAFDDPPRLAASARSQEEVMQSYRRVRDEIRAFVAGIPENLLDSEQ